MAARWGPQAGTLRRVLALCLLAAAAGGGPAPKYGLVIDAGSSGSRLNIYTWPERTANTVPVVRPALPPPPAQAALSKKINPGLSVFAVADINASAVAAYLQPLLDYAAANVPATQRGETPLYLFATAGMRLADPTYAQNLYAVVRAYLLTCPFLFHPTWARTISGEEEGVYGWVTVNAARDTLGATPGSTWGALDLGGASTQITFVPQETPLAGYFDQRIASTSFPLYTHSYLNFGQDRLLARLLTSLAAQNITQNPCRLTGYQETVAGVKMVGAYNAERCKAAIRPLMGLGQYCPVAPCTMWSTYQPAVPAAMSLSLFSAFSYAADFFNCSDLQPVGCVQASAARWCNATSFAAAVAAFAPGGYLADYCVQAAYQSVLLTEAYGLAPDRTVRYAAMDGTWELGWALGAMMAMEGGYFCPASTSNAHNDGDVVLILAVLLGVACLVILVLLPAVLWLCCRARKGTPPPPGGPAAEFSAVPDRGGDIHPKLPL